LILPIDPATLSDLNKAFTDLKAPREKQEKDILHKSLLYIEESGLNMALCKE
jgi:hypothetical protein